MAIREITRYLWDNEEAILKKKKDGKINVVCVWEDEDGCMVRAIGEISDDSFEIPKQKASYKHRLIPDDIKNWWIRSCITWIETLEGDDKDLVLVKAFWPDGGWGGCAALDGTLEL